MMGDIPSCTGCGEYPGEAVAAYIEILEAQLAEARKVIEPFSIMAGELFAQNKNHSDVVMTLHTPDDILRLTFENFHAARAWTEKNDG